MKMYKIVLKCHDSAVILIVEYSDPLHYHTTSIPVHANQSSGSLLPGQHLSSITGSMVAAHNGSVHNASPVNESSGAGM
jgi:hypothetical protein